MIAGEERPRCKQSPNGLWAGIEGKTAEPSCKMGKGLFQGPLPQTRTGLGMEPRKPICLEFYTDRAAQLDSTF